MDTTYLFIIYIIAAYLIGAIATSIWIGRIFYGKDVRTIGSGNAGATNTYRAFGRTTAIAVLLIDIAKGSIAVNIPAISSVLFNTPPLHFNELEYPELVLGLAAVFGHIFPVYEKFKGGKGVATFLGIAIGIDMMVALICINVFAIVFLLYKKVSASSIISGIAFGVSLLIMKHPWNIIDNIIIIIYPLLIIYTHRANIKRLIKGEEPDFTFRKKK
jgi:glycerol-3-phosphate acyltransferase PlsY